MPYANRILKIMNLPLDNLNYFSLHLSDSITSDSIGAVPYKW